MQHLGADKSNVSSNLLRLHMTPFHWKGSRALVVGLVQSKYSIKYVTAPNFDPESSINDLRKLCEGIEDIDKADHTRYVCHHMMEDVRFAPRKVCPLCFRTGVDRVRAVASGAYCISKNHVINNAGALSFGVLYQVDPRRRC